MGAFGQPGLNAGYGSKRRQATLQSQGQMDLHGNRVRQAMQPNQGFAVYMQQAPQQTQQTQQTQQGATGFGVYAPQPAQRPAPMGAAQPTPPPSQGTPYGQPSQWTQPSDPEGYKRYMQARVAEYKALLLEGNRRALDEWSWQSPTGSESMTEEQLRAALAQTEARKKQAHLQNYATASKTPEFQARAAQNRAFEDNLNQAAARKQQEYMSPASVAARQEQDRARQQAAVDQAHMQRVAQLWSWADASQSPDQYTREAHAEMAKRPDLHQGVPILGVDVDRLWLPQDYQRTANQRENSLWSASPTVLSTARPSAVAGLR